MNISKIVRETLCNIKMLIFDSDGVLTDGGVYIDEEGHEMRRFSIKDGAGIKRLQASGIVIAVISSSSASPVTHRAQRLGITEVFVGVGDKVRVAESLLRKYDLTWEQTGFVGDDLADLALLRKVGLAIVVADAVPEAQAIATFKLARDGGQGAIRELSNLFVEQLSSSIELDAPSL